MKRTDRRELLRSLIRGSLVLPFEGLWSVSGGQQVKLPGPVEREYSAQARPAAKGPKSPIEGTPVGVSFRYEEN